MVLETVWCGSRQSGLDYDSLMLREQCSDTLRTVGDLPVKEPGRFPSNFLRVKSCPRRARVYQVPPPPPPMLQFPPSRQLLSASESLKAASGSTNTCSSSRGSNSSGCNSLNSSVSASSVYFILFLL